MLPVRGPDCQARPPRSQRTRPGASANQKNPRSAFRKPGSVPTQTLRLSTLPVTTSRLVCCRMRPEWQVLEGTETTPARDPGLWTRGSRGGTEGCGHCRPLMSSGMRPVSPLESLQDCNSEQCYFLAHFRVGHIGGFSATQGLVLPPSMPRTPSLPNRFLVSVLTPLSPATALLLCSKSVCLSWAEDGDT